MRYKLSFSNIASGAVADTFKTIAAIIAAATVGHRARLLSLQIGPAGDTPTDVAVAVKLNRTNQATAGTCTAVTAANMAKADKLSLDCLMSGGRNYTVEPTTYDTEAPFQLDFNLRGGFLKEWVDPNQMICWGPSQTFGLLIAPRTAVAVEVSGTLEFEIY